MFIPIGIDKPLRRRPFVTEGLILLNLGVYLLGLMGSTFGWFELEQFVTALGFATSPQQPLSSVVTDPVGSRAWGLITYQFIHDPGGLGHIIFNMVFLWVFGRAVESRFRHGGFLAFYLMSGIVAAIAHASIVSGPTLLIGASGSIAGVTGAFLALFPRARVRVLILFFFIGIIEVPALFLLALFFTLDLLRQTMSLLGSADNSVAYMAHIAGYIFGFVLAFSMLGLKVLKREEFDIWFMLVQARRRAAFRQVQQKTRGTMWDTRAAAAPGGASKRPAAPALVELTADERLVAEARTEISELIARHELDDAARAYVEKCSELGAFVLPESRQLDIASKLYAQGRSQDAASAYELFLVSYPRSSNVAEVQLLLAVLYARTLNNEQRARELVDAAREQLRDSSQKQLAEELRAELKPA